MTTSAVVMMVIALALVWGGLIVAAVHLRAHPDEPEDARAAGAGTATSFHGPFDDPGV